MNKPKAIFCWSGGKDSAYALNKVLEEKNFEVCYLLTTLNEQYHRISMHGVREELLELQAASIGIELIKVTVLEGTNEEYERQMADVLLKAKGEGITHIIYGDIFLDDLREYREKNMEKLGMTCVFPLWKMDTAWLINDFIAKGFKTITTCVNDEHLNEEFVGRTINAEFVNSRPSIVDPCGENGEFHTFCYAGPLFKKQIEFTIGETVYKPLELKPYSNYVTNTKGFWFCDLIAE